MFQLTQKLKDGKIQIMEVPIPALFNGHVLVKNYYSLISPGTEGSTVKAARKGYLGKAKERPQQVSQVLDTLKNQGLVQTYRAVIKRLESYSPLGYSCAGEIIDVAPDVTAFSVGDLVACGGITACHAEVVSVPVNLCVKLIHDADLKHAAYNTLGAIAMQATRQADLRIGETCAVIGLGLLGQLIALLLRAAGIRVVGIDIDQSAVDIADKNCVDIALNRNEKGVEEKIADFTSGLGCDGVIIAASSDSLDPINFAGAISRKKGTIVILGNVPTGFDREPHFYKKELYVKMSCSYGPGRYDPNYEEKGLDYPPAYVRWTENRNMQTFQELIAKRKIDINHLTTHIFNLGHAPKAYDMILEKSESYFGILIEYDRAREVKREKIVTHDSLSISDSCSLLTSHPSHVSIGFIGAGSYAQSHLLPNIPKTNDTSLKGIMTATGTSSLSVAERFGFEFCTSDEKDLFTNQDINTIFIATRHDSHAKFAIEALNAGKNVFVEKPLCLNPKELEDITKIYNTQQETRSVKPIIMVGYNRRFSPLARIIKGSLGKGPMAMQYRINAGKISPDSWIQDPEVGGGRIIGEVCHFVDFLTFLNGSLPISVYANAMNSTHNLRDTINISLAYQNGSIGTISYFSNGDKQLSKECVEIYSNGCIAVLDDFKSLTLYTHGKKRKKRFLNQDKGQKREVQCFIEAISGKWAESISFQEIYSTSMVTFKIIESLKTHNCLLIPNISEDP